MLDKPHRVPAIAVILYLFLCLPAWGFGLFSFSGGGGSTAEGEAPAACDTAQDGFTGSASGGEAWATYSGKDYLSSQITAGGTYTACAMDIYVSATGSPSGNIYVYVYDDNAGEPGSLVGSGSSAYDVSGIGGTEEVINITGMSASISNGATYHIVGYRDTVDGSNYISWYKGNTSPEHIWRSSDASSWTNVDTTKGLKYQLYSQ